MQRNEFSVMIAGKAGFGIDKASLIIARVMNRLGWRVYIYRDYPSLIRGGHTYSIIRGCEHEISCHRMKIDFLLALNQESIALHEGNLAGAAVVIYDNSVSAKISPPRGCTSIGIEATDISKQFSAPEITRNACLIGAWAKSMGIEYALLQDILKSEIHKEFSINDQVAFAGFNKSSTIKTISPPIKDPVPLISGSQAMGLGLIAGGLDVFIAYPMTPASPLLHYLAEIAKEVPLTVIHPENEIAVIMMALGFAYAGKKAAVSTSGGGFCLMTEGVSFSGMAEIPVVVMLGQRPGPSTGLPTYTAQGDLDFVLSAGHGEFCRFVVAPSDAKEAYFWSKTALEIAWKFQIPAFILADKTLAEGIYSAEGIKSTLPQKFYPQVWDKSGEYARYALTDSGISPLAFPGDQPERVKVSSYEHDQQGISTEDPSLTVLMQKKRLQKFISLNDELEQFEVVKTYAHLSSEVAIVCWGSNKGVCQEAGEILGFRVVQPVVMCPFPFSHMSKALEGVKSVMCVENNATGQLATLLEESGISINKRILRFDGRPFALEELLEEIKKAGIDAG